MAILTKKTHALGANVGILSGVFLNVYLWLYAPEIFWFWWNAIGCFVTIGVGILVSSVIKKKTSFATPKSYSTGIRELAILFGYFIIIILVSSLLPKIY